MMIFPKLERAFLLLILALTLSACGMIQERPDSARGITLYATIKATKYDPARAEKIERIATNVREYATGNKMLTIEILVEAIRQEAGYDNMLPEDKILTDLLLAELRSGLEGRFGADVLPEDLQLAVDTVADWIIQAARMI